MVEAMAFYSEVCAKRPYLPKTLLSEKELSKNVVILIDDFLNSAILSEAKLSKRGGRLLNICTK